MKERIKELVEQAEDWADNQNFYASDYRDYLMEKFAALVRADEREACAKVADRQNGDDEEDSESCVWSKAARHIAAAIRARGSK